MTKAALRAAAAANRAGRDPQCGHRLAGHVLAARCIPPGSVVAGYWPIGAEIDPRPLLLALMGRGHAVLLPETPPRGHPLTFRRWRPNTPMLPGPLGTSRPDAPAATPTLLLVPLLAFDRHGHRLGYGGGYYDRTIAALGGVRTIAALGGVRTIAALGGVPTIGCAYASQQVDAVPVLPHDAGLDAVATEAGVFLPESRCASSS